MGRIEDGGIGTGGGGTDRRRLLKQAAIGGAAVWVAPAVLQGAAAAASTPEGPPEQGCTFQTVFADWKASNAAIPAEDILWIDDATMPAPNTGWHGSNVDLVRGTYPTTPPVWASTNWLDLVGFTNLGVGTLTTSVIIPPNCTGQYFLSFSAVQQLGAHGAEVTVSMVPSTSAPVVDTFEPPETDGATYNYYIDVEGGETVVITFTGTSSDLPDAGALIGTIVFSTPD